MEIVFPLILPRPERQLLKYQNFTSMYPAIDIKGGAYAR